MSSKKKTLEKRMDNIEEEIKNLKSDILDISRKIGVLSNQTNQRSVLDENHGHQLLLTSGPPVFLQDLYEARLKQQQQQQEKQQSKDEEEEE